MAELLEGYVERDMNRERQAGAPVNSGISIRFAASSDAEKIAEIKVLSWQAAYRSLMPDVILDNLDAEKEAAGWKKWIESGETKVLLACCNEEIIGFCSLHAYLGDDLDREIVGEIPAIYFLPSQWRKGAGTQLMTAALNELGIMGFKEAALWVLKTNQKARAFYEKVGFKCDGAEKVESGLVGCELCEVRYRGNLPQ